MRIAIAGLGTVGAEVARQLIHENALGARVTAVSARNASRDRGFSMEGVTFVNDPVALAARDDVDAVIELIGGEDGPALALVEAAIAQGKPVISANKALLARHGQRVVAAAEEAGVALAAEAAVAGGIPCLKMIREGLAGNRINRISGILNGTCNYILTTMEKTGRGFDDVLKEAQDLGYAEADPGFDIDGIDAAHKLALLAAIGFGIAPDTEAISITGIRAVKPVDIRCAADLGYVIRLIGVAEREDGGIRMSVEPTMVPHHSALAKVDGPLNAVSVDAEPVGTITAIGPGAGAGATASAVLADLADLIDGRSARFFGAPAATLAAGGAVTSVSTAVSRYYANLSVYDRPGVLADVTAVLRDAAISVESILQHGRADDGSDGSVPVVITTHETTADAMARAIEAIADLDSVIGRPAVMAIAAGGDDS
ncbi:MAG: homoserine dehydrogenase [Candidatus Puniceispirillales bacterium]